MANYSNLNSNIRNAIKTNGKNEITGALLQQVLLSMVSNLGAQFQLAGILSPSTPPITPPDYNVAYLAGPGTYTNFNGIVVPEGRIGVIMYNGSWAVQTIVVGGGGGGSIPIATNVSLGGIIVGSGLSIDASGVLSVIGGGGSGTSFEPEETDLALVPPAQSGQPYKLKFADRLRESNITTGKNYIILRETATFASQVTLQNAIYEIRYEYDLNGATFNVPANCTLLFNGGKLTNGTIVGNDTLMTGEVNVPMLSGSFIGTLHSSWINLTGYDKLKSLLVPTSDMAVIDEDITISSFSGKIQAGTKKIDGNGHLINVTADCTYQSSGTTYAEILIQSSVLEQVCNIEFNFNNHTVACATYVDAHSDVDIHHVSVKNIKSMYGNPSWGISGVYVKVYENILVNIHDSFMDHLCCLGDGTPNTLLGSVAGVSVLNASLNSKIKVSGIIINEIYNFDSSNTRILDDSVGIYVSNSTMTGNNSTAEFTDIFGVEFGYRLIKTDSTHVIVRRVRASQETDRGVAVIGCNSGNISGNITGDCFVEDVILNGITGSLLATSLSNNTLSNVEMHNTGQEHGNVIRLQENGSGQEAVLNNIICENAMIAYSNSSGASSIRINTILVKMNTGSIRYLLGFNNTKVEIVGYSFVGTVRTVINFLAGNNNTLHIYDADIVANQGYNALFNASNTIDFAIRNFTISGYFQGVFDISNAINLSITDGTVNYLGNPNNLVVGLGTVGSPTGGIIKVANVTKTVASGVSYLYGFRVSYNGETPLEIFIDESAAPFNVTTKGKVYWKEHDVLLYDRDIDIPAKVEGARAMVINNYVDIPIKAVYAGGWRILNMPAVNFLDHAIDYVTDYGAGSIIYCKNLTKLILFNGTSWVNVDGSSLT